jgi:hypothetical protein
MNRQKRTAKAVKRAMIYGEDQGCSAPHSSARSRQVMLGRKRRVPMGSRLLAVSIQLLSLGFCSSRRRKKRTTMTVKPPRGRLM